MFEIITVLASVYWQDQYVYNGSRYNRLGLSAAHRTLPMGTCLMLSYKSSMVKVVINDRGPCFSKKCQATRPDLLKRELDISLGAAMMLKFNGLDKLQYWKVSCH